MSRKILPKMSPCEFEIPIFELHETKDDTISQGWLTAGIKAFCPKLLSTYSPAPASAFAKTSKCSIQGCNKVVEVGAHTTVDGKKLWIVPTCKAHNATSALDKLGVAARLKRCTVFIEVSLPKGKRIKVENGKYKLDNEIDPDLYLLSVSDLFHEDEEEEE